MAWDWPQWIYGGLVILALLMNVAKDGEPRDGHYSAGSALVVAIMIQVLLYFGGFWTP